MKKSGASQGQSASELISKRIAELGDWRGETLEQDAQAHQGSRPGRRRGVEVDGHSGLVARRHHLHRRVLQEGREAHLRQGRVSEGPGPALQLEPRRKVRRAIDIHEGEEVDEAAFKALVRQAVALNTSRWHASSEAIDPKHPWRSHSLVEVGEMRTTAVKRLGALCDDGPMSAPRSLGDGRLPRGDRRRRAACVIGTAGSHRRPLSHEA